MVVQLATGWPTTGMGDSRRYRAFMSYSHSDAAVAARLHRSLENYRVPKRLRGTPGEFGPVPERLNPIFRNREELGVSYVIWRQRIDTGSGFRPMADRGSPTANHFDHVHVSFEPGAGSGSPISC